MARVKCSICGNVGYTASPDYARCTCGGALVVIAEPARVGKLNWIKRELNLLICSFLFKQLYA